MSFLKTYQKYVASLVIVSFVTSFFALPPPVLAQPTLEKIPLSFVPLGIPPELASVEEVFIPDPKNATGVPLIHIQSVHAHGETQRKIYGLLKLLDEKYGINALYIEGAGEELSPDYFRFFDDNRLNVRVAERLVEKGELTGAELFLIESQKKIPAYGLEDPSLYRDNLMSFQRVMLRRPLTSRFVEETRARLDRLETLLLSPRARKLLRSSESFDAGQRELLSYALELERQAKEILELDLRHYENQLDWPQMIRLLRLQELETKLEPEKIQSDRQKLTGFLRQIQVEPSLVESFENLSFSPFRAGMVYDPGFRKNDLPRYLAERLVEATMERGFSFERYPSFTRYLEAAILQSELEAERLFAELEKLFETLLRTVSAREEEGKLVRLVHEERLLERLFDLELTPKDYAKVEESRREDRPLVRFLLGIESLQEATGRGHQEIVPDDIETIETVYGEARRFYSLAKEREEVMVEKIVHSSLREPSSVIASPAKGGEAIAEIASPPSAPRNDKGVTILITGGFHTEGLSRSFRKKQIPYTILSPRITEKVSPEAYVSSLLGEKKTAFDTQYLEAAVKLISRLVREKMTSPELMENEIKLALESLFEIAVKAKVSAEEAVYRVNNSLYAEDRRFRLQFDENKSGVFILDYTNPQSPVPLKNRHGKIIFVPVTTLKVETPIFAVRSAPVPPLTVSPSSSVSSISTSFNLDEEEVTEKLTQAVSAPRAEVRGSVEGWKKVGAWFGLPAAIVALVLTGGSTIRSSAGEKPRALQSEKPVVGTTSDDPKALEVFWGTYRIAQYDKGKVEHIQTMGCQTCIVTILYDPQTKTGAIAHFERETLVEKSFNKIFKGLEKLGVDFQNLQVTVLGGWNIHPGELGFKGKSSDKARVLILEEFKKRRLNPKVGDLNPPGTSENYDLDLHTGRINKYEEGALETPKDVHLKFLNEMLKKGTKGRLPLGTYDRNGKPVLPLEEEIERQDQDSSPRAEVRSEEEKVIGASVFSAPQTSRRQTGRLRWSIQLDRLPVPFVPFRELLSWGEKPTTPAESISRPKAPGQIATTRERRGRIQRRGVRPEGLWSSPSTSAQPPVAERAQAWLSPFIMETTLSVISGIVNTFFDENKYPIFPHRAEVRTNPIEELSVEERKIIIGAVQFWAKVPRRQWIAILQDPKFHQLPDGSTVLSYLEKAEAKDDEFIEAQRKVFDYLQQYHPSESKFDELVAGIEKKTPALRQAALKKAWSEFLNDLIDLWEKRPTYFPVRFLMYHHNLQKIRQAALHFSDEENLSYVKRADLIEAVLNVLQAIHEDNRTEAEQKFKIYLELVEQTKDLDFGNLKNIAEKAAENYGLKKAPFVEKRKLAVPGETQHDVFRAERGTLVGKAQLDEVPKLAIGVAAILIEEKEGHIEVRRNPKFFNPLLEGRDPESSPLAEIERAVKDVLMQATGELQQVISSLEGRRRIQAFLDNNAVSYFVFVMQHVVYERVREGLRETIRTYLSDRLEIERTDVKPEHVRKYAQFAIQEIKRVRPQSKIALLHIMPSNLQIVIEGEVGSDNPTTLVLEKNVYQFERGRRDAEGMLPPEKVVFGRWQGRRFMFYTSRSHTIRGALVRTWRQTDGFTGGWIIKADSTTYPENVDDLPPELSISLDEILPKLVLIPDQKTLIARIENLGFLLFRFSNELEQIFAVQNPLDLNEVRRVLSEDTLRNRQIQEALEWKANELRRLIPVRKESLSERIRFSWRWPVVLAVLTVSLGIGTYLIGTKIASQRDQQGQGKKEERIEVKEEEFTEIKLIDFSKADMAEVDLEKKPYLIIQYESDGDAELQFMFKNKKGEQILNDEGKFGAPVRLPYSRGRVTTRIVDLSGFFRKGVSDQKATTLTFTDVKGARIEILKIVLASKKGLHTFGRSEVRAFEDAWQINRGLAKLEVPFASQEENSFDSVRAGSQEILKGFGDGFLGGRVDPDSNNVKFLGREQLGIGEIFVKGDKNSSLLSGLTGNSDIRRRRSDPAGVIAQGSKLPEKPKRDVLIDQELHGRGGVPKKGGIPGSLRTQRRSGEQPARGLKLDLDNNLRPQFLPASRPPQGVQEPHRQGFGFPGRPVFHVEPGNQQLSNSPFLKLAPDREINTALPLGQVSSLRPGRAEVRHHVEEKLDTARSEFLQAMDLINQNWDDEQLRKTLEVDTPDPYGPRYKYPIMRDSTMEEWSRITQVPVDQLTMLKQLYAAVLNLERVKRLWKEAPEHPDIQEMLMDIGEYVSWLDTYLYKLWQTEIDLQEISELVVEDVRKLTSEGTTIAIDIAAYLGDLDKKLREGDSDSRAEVRSEEQSQHLWSEIESKLGLSGLEGLGPSFLIYFLDSLFQQANQVLDKQGNRKISHLFQEGETLKALGERLLKETPAWKVLQDDQAFMQEAAQFYADFFFERFHDSHQDKMSQEKHQNYMDLTDVSVDWAYQRLPRTDKILTPRISMLDVLKNYPGSNKGVLDVGSGLSGFHLITAWPFAGKHPEHPLILVEANPFVAKALIRYKERTQSNSQIIQQEITPSSILDLLNTQKPRLITMAFFLRHLDLAKEEPYRMVEMTADWAAKNQAGIILIDGTEPNAAGLTLDFKRLANILHAKGMGVPQVHPQKRSVLIGATFRRAEVRGSGFDRTIGQKLVITVKGLPKVVITVVGFRSGRGGRARIGFHGDHVIPINRKEAHSSPQRKPKVNWEDVPDQSVDVTREGRLTFTLPKGEIIVINQEIEVEVSDVAPAQEGNKSVRLVHLLVRVPEGMSVIPAESFSRAEVRSGFGEEEFFQVMDEVKKRVLDFVSGTISREKSMKFRETLQKIQEELKQGYDPQKIRAAEKRRFALEFVDAVQTIDLHILSRLEMVRSKSPKKALPIEILLQAPPKRKFLSVWKETLEALLKLKELLHPDGTQETVKDASSEKPPRAEVRAADEIKSILNNLSGKTGWQKVSQGVSLLDLVQGKDDYGGSRVPELTQLLEKWEKESQPEAWLRPLKFALIYAGHNVEPRPEALEVAKGLDQGKIRTFFAIVHAQIVGQGLENSPLQSISNVVKGTGGDLSPEDFIRFLKEISRALENLSRAEVRKEEELEEDRFEGRYYVPRNIFHFGSHSQVMKRVKEKVEEGKLKKVVVGSKEILVEGLKNPFEVVQKEIFDQFKTPHQAPRYERLWGPDDSTLKISPVTKEWPEFYVQYAPSRAEARRILPGRTTVVRESMEEMQRFRGDTNNIGIQRAEVRRGEAERLFQQLKELALQLEKQWRVRPNREQGQLIKGLLEKVFDFQGEIQIRPVDSGDKLKAGDILASQKSGGEGTPVMTAALFLGKPDFNPSWGSVIDSEGNFTMGYLSSLVESYPFSLVPRKPRAVYETKVALEKDRVYQVVLEELPSESGEGGKAAVLRRVDLGGNDFAEERLVIERTAQEIEIALESRHQIKGKSSSERYPLTGPQAKAENLEKSYAELVRYASVLQKAFQQARRESGVSPPVSDFLLDLYIYVMSLKGSISLPPPSETSPSSRSEVRREPEKGWFAEIVPRKEERYAPGQIQEKWAARLREESPKILFDQLKKSLGSRVFYEEGARRTLLLTDNLSLLDRRLGGSAIFSLEGSHFALNWQIFPEKDQTDQKLTGYRLRLQLTPEAATEWSIPSPQESFLFETAFEIRESEPVRYLSPRVYNEKGGEVTVSREVFLKSENYRLYAWVSQNGRSWLEETKSDRPKTGINQVVSEIKKPRPGESSKSATFVALRQAFVEEAGGLAQASERLSDLIQEFERRPEKEGPEAKRFWEERGIHWENLLTGYQDWLIEPVTDTTAVISDDTPLSPPLTLPAADRSPAPERAEIRGYEKVQKLFEKDPLGKRKELLDDLRQVIDEAIQKSHEDEVFAHVADFTGALKGRIETEEIIVLNQGKLTNDFLVFLEENLGFFKDNGFLQVAASGRPKALLLDFLKALEIEATPAAQGRSPRRRAEVRSEETNVLLAGEDIVVADKTDTSKLNVKGVHDISELTGEKKINKIIELDPVVLMVRSATVVDEALVQKLKRLKYIIRLGHGLDNIQVSKEILEKRGIEVLGTKGSARSVLAWILRAAAVAKQRQEEKEKGTPTAEKDEAPESFLPLPSFREASEGKIQKRPVEEQPLLRAKSEELLRPLRGETIQSLEGTTLAIIGPGDIGSALASTAQGLGMKVLVNSRTMENDPSKRPDPQTSGYEFATKDEIYRKSHYIVLLTGLKGETKGMIDEAAIDKMMENPNLIALINPDRGGIVDEKAVARLIREKQIQYVVDEIPKTEELKQLALYTDHISGSTREAEAGVLEKTNQILDRIRSRAEVRAKKEDQEPAKVSSAFPKNLVHLKKVIDDLLTRILKHTGESRFTSTVFKMVQRPAQAKKVYKIEKQKVIKGLSTDRETLYHKYFADLVHLVWFLQADEGLETWKANIISTEGKERPLSDRRHLIRYVESVRRAEVRTTVNSWGEFETRVNEWTSKGVDIKAVHYPSDPEEYGGDASEMIVVKVEEKDLLNVGGSFRKELEGKISTEPPFDIEILRFSGEDFLVISPARAEVRADSNVVRKEEENLIKGITRIITSVIGQRQAHKVTPERVKNLLAERERLSVNLVIQLLNEGKGGKISFKEGQAEAILKQIRTFFSNRALIGTSAQALDQKVSEVPMALGVDPALLAVKIEEESLRGSLDYPEFDRALDMGYALLEIKKLNILPENFMTKLQGWEGVLKIVLGISDIQLLESQVDFENYQFLQNLFLLINSMINTSFDILWLGDNKVVVLERDSLRHEALDEGLARYPHRYGRLEKEILRLDSGLDFLVVQDMVRGEGFFYDLHRYSRSDSFQKLESAKRTVQKVMEGENLKRYLKNPITDLAFPTAREAEVLEGTLRSYLKAIQDFGHEFPSLWVFDDATGEKAKLKQEMLARLGLSFGIPIYYVGEEEKEKYLDSLADSESFRQKGLNRTQIEERYFQKGKFGSNRNFIHSYLSGKIYATVDDDSPSYVTLETKLAKAKPLEEFLENRYALIQKTMEELKKKNLISDELLTPLQREMNLDYRKHHLTPWLWLERLLKGTYAGQTSQGAIGLDPVVTENFQQALYHYEVDASEGRKTFSNAIGLPLEARRETLKVAVDAWGIHGRVIGQPVENVKALNFSATKGDRVYLNGPVNGGNIRVVSSLPNLFGAGSVANDIYDFARTGEVEALRGMSANPQANLTYHRMPVVSGRFHLNITMATIDNRLSQGHVVPEILDSDLLGLAVQGGNSRSKLYTPRTTMDHERGYSATRHGSLEEPIDVRRLAAKLVEELAVVLAARVFYQQISFEDAVKEFAHFLYLVVHDLRDSAEKELTHELEDAIEAQLGNHPFPSPEEIIGAKRLKELRRKGGETVLNIPLLIERYLKPKEAQSTLEGILRQYLEKMERVQEYSKEIHESSKRMREQGLLPFSKPRAEVRRDQTIFRRSEKAFGETIENLPKDSRLNKSLSPVTTRRALPPVAHSRTASSAGSRQALIFTLGSTITAFIWMREMISSKRLGETSRFNLGFSRTRKKSSKRAGESTRVNLSSSSASTILRQVPGRRRALTRTLMSRTTRITFLTGFLHKLIDRSLGNGVFLSAFVNLGNEGAEALPPRFAFQASEQVNPLRRFQLIDNLFNFFQVDFNRNLGHLNFPLSIQHKVSTRPWQMLNSLLRRAEVRADENTSLQKVVTLQIVREQRSLSLFEILEMLESDTYNLGDYIFEKLNPGDQKTILASLSPAKKRHRDISELVERELSALLAKYPNAGIIDLEERKNENGPGEVIQRQKNVFALGEDYEARGMSNFFEFVVGVIEGEIKGWKTGGLIYGDPNYTAGPHGPFYVVMKERYNDWHERAAHRWYLVPEDSDRQVILALLQKSVDAKILTPEFAQKVEEQVISYEQFVQFFVEGEFVVKGQIRLGESILKIGVKKNTVTITEIDRQGKTLREAQIYDGKNRIVIGRSEEADFKPLDAGQKGVSRRHAVIELRGQDLYLLDLGSTNGTWVGGVKIDPQKEEKLYLIPKANPRAEVRSDTQEGDFERFLREIETKPIFDEILRPRERKVLRLRLERKSLREVGGFLRISKERVRQIEDRALEKVRSYHDFVRAQETAEKEQLDIVSLNLRSDTGRILFDRNISKVGKLLRIPKEVLEEFLSYGGMRQLEERLTLLGLKLKTKAELPAAFEVFGLSVSDATLLRAKGIADIDHLLEMSRQEVESLISPVDAKNVEEFLRGLGFSFAGERVNDSIDSLNISVRLKRSLKDAQIRTVTNLLLKNEADLARLYDRYGILSNDRDRVEQIRKLHRLQHLRPRRAEVREALLPGQRLLAEGSLRSETRFERGGAVIESGQIPLSQQPLALSPEGPIAPLLLLGQLPQALEGRDWRSEVSVIRDVLAYHQIDPEIVYNYPRVAQGLLDVVKLELDRTVPLSGRIDRALFGKKALAPQNAAGALAAKIQKVMQPTGRLHVFKGVPREVEFLATVWPALVTGQVSFEVVLTPGSLASEGDRKRLAQLRAEVRKLVPGRIDILTPQTNEELAKILQGTGQRFGRKFSGLGVAGEFKDRVGVSVSETLWEEFGIENLIEEGIQRFLLASDLDNEAAKGAGSLVITASLLGVLPVHKRSEMRIGSNTYRVEKVNLGDYLTSVANALENLRAELRAISASA